METVEDSVEVHQVRGSRTIFNSSLMRWRPQTNKLLHNATVVLFTPLFYLHSPFISLSPSYALCALLLCWLFSGSVNPAALYYNVGGFGSDRGGYGGGAPAAGGGGYGDRNGGGDRGALGGGGGYGRLVFASSLFYLCFPGNSLWRLATCGKFLRSRVLVLLQHRCATFFLVSWLAAR